MTNFLEKNRNEILKSSFALSNQAIYWIDKEGSFVFANDNALDCLGYSLEELLELKLWDIDVNFNSKEKYISALNSFKNNEFIENSNIIETSHRKKTGEVFPVEVVSKFKIIDSKEYVISYVKDITNRLERTQKINLYFELINSSSDMIFLINKENEMIEFANEKVCKSLGYSLAELKSKKISEIRKPFEGSQKIDIPEVFRRLEEKKNLITFGIYKSKNGTEIPVESSLHLKNYLDANFVTAISRDIRERIEIEKEKEELNIKLKEYNRTLQQEISKAKKELIEYETMMKKQSKMAAMGEMIENIAHQWRQPLSAVSVLSSGMILQNEQSVLDKELLSSGLNTIHEQVQYLSKTIDDFRNFFKPDKEKNLFEIRDLVQSAIKLIKSRFNQLSIIFTLDIEDMKLFTYENEFLQVLLNIISNAVDELIKKKNKKIIAIKFYTDETFIILEIKDSGGGISEKIIDRIFEPYFTTKHRYHGTGIGLYMSNNIVKHLHGQIDVRNELLEYENKVYKGACFSIKLPLDTKKEIDG
ncbi:PAS domain S-box protein [Halarcobacter sp.]|uniref:PAS domain-containing sensor histidine kinase n=1 Tax=Halarcobacter sp. TaxID=2321133 RepID=UPI002AAA6CC8|nr:PAS domain S-box protein [Halarcobacter sp.]